MPGPIETLESLYIFFVDLKYTNETRGPKVSKRVFLYAERLFFKQS